MKKRYFTLLSLICFLCVNGFSQVLINEFSAANLNNFLDNYDKTEDWIELYNDSNAPVDLSGWYLSDKQDNPTKWPIPVGTTIEAYGFLLIWCSGRDEAVDGNYHSNFKLSQTKTDEFVSLALPSGSIVDIHPLAVCMVENSRCRNTDAGTEWKYCVEPTPGYSNDGSNQINGYTQRPTMDLAAGFYSSNQVVTITNNEPNSVLRYTLDGTNPTPSSPAYSSPLTISSTTVVKAQAFSFDALIHPGQMEFNTYFINEDYSLAVFSVAADQVIELANGNGNLIPIGSLEYFNVDKEREATSFGSLNRHGQDSWVLPHRSLDWISRDEMSYSRSVMAPLFNYSDRDEYQRFMFRNSGDDNYPAINDNDHEGSTHIRDEYVQTLAHNGEMALDLRAVERVILFLNGQYWGVYGMRERPVDHDYTAYYYDQNKYQTQYLTTWGNTEIPYGGTAALNEWISLRDFILDDDTDMSLPINYQIADDSIKMLSLIDYMIMNLNVVASDWLNYNTGWWRGRNPSGDHKKWGYILWDLDATFDYYINYSGVPNTDPDAVPCDLEDIADYMDDFFDNDGFDTPPEECNTIINGISPYPATDSIFALVIQMDPWCCNIGWDGQCQDEYDAFLAGAPLVVGDVGRHEKIFLKLLDQNATFKQLYYSRQADLANTVFDCDNMINTLDSMLAVIEPEMPRQIDRWGGSIGEWQSNVQNLKDFILERCTLLDDGMIDCYDELEGPYEVTLLTQPNGIGEIDFNTLDIEVFPWTGDYFGGMENLMSANVWNENEDDWEFSHWISTSGNTISPDPTERNASISLTQADTIIAVFASLSSIDNLDKEIGLNIYPNPAKGDLVLEYDLERTRNVQIEMYSTLGQQVASFPAVGGIQSAGPHRVHLNLAEKGIGSGMFILVLKADNEQVVRKVTLMQ